MQNAEIARLFDELGDLLEIQAANPFRVRAYRNAARTILDCPESVYALADDVKRLQELPGIGEDLAKKIQVLAQSGSIPQLEELRQQVPRGVVEMLRIPGLGPKKVFALFNDLKIQSLEDLRKAAESDQIAPLKGFGKKTQETILKGIPLAEKSGLRVYLIDAKAAADEIVADLKTVPGVSQVAAAGSCRRRKETCGDLDILAATADSTAIMDRLATNRLVTDVIARGDTKQTVNLRSGLQLDLRVVPEESFGAALQYFTGSKEHNVVLRRRAQERDLKLNEWGLFHGEKPIAGPTEEGIYEALGLAWVPPELRENRGEIALAEAGSLPKLIDVGDIRGDLHMHTTATDGHATIEEMAEAAKARGLEYIAITDHSKRVSMAMGLDGPRLRSHWKDIDAVQKRTKGIRILKGVECDILEDATLDLPDDVLAEADWVLAVLHYGLGQPRSQIMKRLLVAIENPHVHAIGHPSGRLIGKRPGADIDYETLLAAAAEHGKMLEINAHPKRLDLDDVQAAAAKSKGIPIVINTDSHSTEGLSMLEYGIYQARRAGLTAADVANTLTWPALVKRLSR